VEERLPDRLKELGTRYFELLNGLSDLRSEYEEEFLSGVLASATRPGREAPPALELGAPLGGTTSTSLLLTNTRNQPAVVHCTVTDVRRIDGVGPAFPPEATFAPSGLEIPPHGEATLMLSLRLGESQYEPDVAYVGAVHIEREGEPLLEIPLHVTARPVPARAKPRRAPSSQRRTQRGKATGQGS
jgi:hypothetical protein